MCRRGRYNRGSYAERYDPATGGGGIPLNTTGYIQINDFTDPGNPEMVARYEVPEYGTHNIWVEDDKLFQAYCVSGGGIGADPEHVRATRSGRRASLSTSCARSWL